MATEKLAEGVRKFNSDAQHLEIMHSLSWPKKSGEVGPQRKVRITFRSRTASLKIEGSF